MGAGLAICIGASVGALSRWGLSLWLSPGGLIPWGTLAANLLGFGLPAWSVPTVTRIGASSIVLGLMAAGAGMQFGHLSQAKALGGSVLLIRHVLTPLVALGLARAFGLSAVQSSILLAFSALPTASSAYVLAARMGYNGGYVAGLVTLSTMLGMASLPFALGLGA